MSLFERVKEALGVMKEVKRVSEPSKKKRENTKQPSIRMEPTIVIDDNKAYSLTLGKTKSTFKSSYTIREFELLAAQGKFQEAYWAAHIIRSHGVELDKGIIGNLQLSVEVHWPSIFEEREKEKEERSKELVALREKHQEKKHKMEEAKIAMDWMKGKHHGSS